jgi:predicted alpha/beta hydrolase family esterase
MAGVFGMKIVYVHGASATSESFNYIRQSISDSADIVINYDSRNGFEKNLEDMKQLLIDEEKIFFVAHSLGGIYCLHLADILKNKVVGAVTLSTPYGGAEIADVAKYFLPYSRLLKDIGPNSYAMKHSRNIKKLPPWTNVVTTKGSAPWVPGKNDGVVTIASQMFRDDIMELIELDYNHYEVVLSDRVVKIIQERLPNAG